MTDRERPGGPQYVVPMLYFDSHVFIFLSELFSIYTVIYFLTTVCLYSIDTKVFRWDIYLCLGYTWMSVKIKPEYPLTTRKVNIFQQLLHFEI